MKRFLLWLLMVFLGQNFVNATFHRAVVQVPVVDLRREFTDISVSALQRLHETSSAYYAYAPSIFNADNPLLETQLLFGEHVFIEPYNDEWVKVLAIEQPVYRAGAWSPYPGFAKTAAFYAYEDFMPDYSRAVLVVATRWATLYGYRITDGFLDVECKLADVSLGTTFGVGREIIDAAGQRWYQIKTPRGNAVIKKDAVMVVQKDVVLNPSAELMLRISVVEMALQFIGSPYSWGGASAWLGHLEHPGIDLADCITGPDCSSLTYLAHKAFGLLIPRDAGDQYLDSAHITRGDCLATGDLIFLAKPIPAPDGVTQFKIGHVLFYCGKDSDGDDLLLESQGIFYSKNSAGDYFIAPQMIDPPFGCRTIKVKDHLLFKHYALTDLISGQRLTVPVDGVSLERRVFFGTFFTSEKIALARRSLFALKSLTRYEEFLAH